MVTTIPLTGSITATAQARNGGHSLQGTIARNLCMILDARTGQPYYDLSEILKDKNYYILTTNQDTQFTRLFPEEKISAIQGDWRCFQCSSRCHDGLYDSVETLHKLNDAIDSDLRVPTDMIPRCPKCGAEMEPWVRSWTFLEGKKYSVRNTVNSSVPAKEHTQKNPVFGAWRWPYDTDVYPGAVLEPDIRISGCLLYHHQSEGCPSSGEIKE